MSELPNSESIDSLEPLLFVQPVRGHWDRLCLVYLDYEHEASALFLPKWIPAYPDEGLGKFGLCSKYI